MENHFTLFSNHSNKNNSIGELFDPDRFLEPDLNFKIAICITNAFLSLTALLGNSAILITFLTFSSEHLTRKSCCIRPRRWSSRSAFRHSKHNKRDIRCLFRCYHFRSLSDHRVFFHHHSNYCRSIARSWVTLEISCSCGAISWYMASYFHSGIRWHSCMGKHKILDCKLISGCHICCVKQPSTWKLPCLFENLFCCSTPSETDSTYASPTRTKQRQHFEHEKIQEVSHEHISRFRFTAILLLAFFVHRLFSIYRCNYFTKSFRHSFLINFLELFF